MFIKITIMIISAPSSSSSSKRGPAYPDWGGRGYGGVRWFGQCPIVNVLLLMTSSVTLPNYVCIYVDLQQVVFKFGGIYLDTDTISVRPLRHHLRSSFVAFSLPWHNIQNAIFGFPQVQTLYLSFLVHRQEIWVNLCFTQKCIERDKIYFAAKQRKSQ